MLEPKSIDVSAYEHASMRYDYLLERGIELIQKYSGKQWTDFNYHDPGITILEQLCYALTDLGYKTNFPIEDLLFTSDKSFDLEKLNLFIPPSKIFPSSPTTVSDFRKIIIEQAENIKNAWVTPVRDHLLGHKGLYSVLLQFNDDVQQTEINESIKDIENLLVQNRSICTDFDSIIILKEDRISITGKINLNSFALGETVLAEVYHKVELMFNKEIFFHDYEQMENEGMGLEKLYAGPSPKNSYLDPDELFSKTNEIYISEIKEIIEKVDGVVNVEDLVVYKNGIRVFNDIIPFDEDCYPTLEKSLDDLNKSPLQLDFYRNRSKYEMDSLILTQLYNNLTGGDRGAAYKSLFKQKSMFASSRFSQQELEHYYPVQNELPSIYGLKENELPQSSTRKRKAQVQQLRAYLYLFEQVMANHLSQLSNIRTLFAVDGTVEQTYYNQIPGDIAEIDKVLNSDDQGKHLENINRIRESNYLFLERKNHVIDHLLARFGESFDTTILSNLERSFDETSDVLSSLRSKLDYAKNIVELGHDRILGFNYRTKVKGKENLSGLEKRLKLILNIKNLAVNSLRRPIFQNSAKKKSIAKWELSELVISGRKDLKVLSKANASYRDNEVEFYCKNYDEFKSLLVFAAKQKSYRIVKSNGLFHLLYTSPVSKHPSIIYTSESRNKCRVKIDQTIKKYKTLNNECEGLYLIEHILLRSSIKSNYLLHLIDDEENTLLKSIAPSELSIQQNIQQDLIVIASIPENYIIERTKGEPTYEIVLQDILGKKILKDPNTYQSRTNAEDQIQQIIEYVALQKIESKDSQAFSKIVKQTDTASQFPEDFEYSNHISIILPDWPVRMQSREFMAYINNMVSTFIPAYLGYSIYFLNLDDIEIFEQTYYKWLDSMVKKDADSKEKLSLKLIKLLQSYNSYQ